jgi:hypothetical protein
MRIIRWITGGIEMDLENLALDAGLYNQRGPTERALARFADAVLEEAAKEADIWQEITDRRGRSNKDGVYIAAAIRGMKSNAVRVHDEPHVANRIAS